jgi:hypothetical protein
VLFLSRSTVFPPILDKKSTGLSTGEKRVIPAKIRCFSARFATGFRTLYQHRSRLHFHQLSRAISGVAERTGPEQKRAKKKRNPHSVEKHPVRSIDYQR